LKKAVDASSTATIKGSKWTEGHLLKLLMLATTNIKSNYAELATQWAKRYRKILTRQALPNNFSLTVRQRTSHSNPPREPSRRSSRH
jgi:hypothetical protein